LSYPGSAGNSGESIPQSPDGKGSSPDSLVGMSFPADSAGWQRNATVRSVYEEPFQSRRIGPALIAVLVVLAALAGTLGYAGTKALLGPSATPTGAPPTSSTKAQGGTQPSQTGSSPGQPTDPGSPAGTDDPNDPPTTRCPSATLAALLAAHLAGDLKLRLYIRATMANASDAEVWVCENADGVLVYQGHVRNGPLSVADNGLNTLLLAEGIKGSVAEDGAGFKAVNPNGRTTTEYHVARDQLIVVDTPSNRQRVYTVITSYP
jgi:hypothetical protein